VSLTDFFHRTATGPERKRLVLTPIGLLVFSGTLVVVIVGGRITDRALSLPPLFPGKVGSVLGSLLLMAGFLMCAWCVLWFWKAGGTPVPMNPPRELIVGGPYERVRNPMVSGVFAMLLGLGFMVHSVGIALIWTPAYLLVHWIELKRVEEPELTRRFGERYAEYKARVPMFVPHVRRRTKGRLPHGGE